jgi:hypothetical protein
MGKRRLQHAVTFFAALMLLFQLVLTADHFHLSGPRLASSAGIAVQPASGGGQRPVHPLDRSDDQCALCWASAASAHSLLPPAIALPVPQASAAEPPAPGSHRVAGDIAAPAFRPRAPPHSLA